MVRPRRSEPSGRLDGCSASPRGAADTRPRRPLGGKDSSFAIKAAPGQVLDSAGQAFAWQHDPEAVGHGTYTFFDNEASATAELPYSRAITVRLSERAKAKPSA